MATTLTAAMKAALKQAKLPPTLVGAEELQLSDPTVANGVGITQGWLNAQKSAKPAPGSGASPDPTGTTTTTGTTQPEPYEAEGLTAGTENLAISPGSFGIFANANFKTMGEAEQWLGHLNQTQLGEVQGWLLNANLLSFNSSSATTYGVLSKATEAAFAKAMDSAYTSGDSIGSYLQNAAAYGSAAAYDQAVNTYVNAKPTVEVNELTSSADIQNSFERAYIAATGMAPTQSQTQQFVNEYQGQQTAFNEQKFGVKNQAESTYEDRKARMAQLAPQLANGGFSDFIKSYTTVMGGSEGQGLEQPTSSQATPPPSSMGEPRQRGPAGTVSPVSKPGQGGKGVDMASYVNPTLWSAAVAAAGSKYSRDEAAGQANTSVEDQRAIFQAYAQKLFQTYGNWQVVTNMLITGHPEGGNTQQEVATAAEGQTFSQDLGSTMSAASGGAISPNGVPTAPVDYTTAQEPELQGASDLAAGKMGGSQEVAQSVASLAGLIISRMFRPGGFSTSSDPTTTAGLPGVAGNEGQAAAFAPPGGTELATTAV